MRRRIATKVLKKAWVWGPKYNARRGTQWKAVRAHMRTRPYLARLVLSRLKDDMRGFRYIGDEPSLVGTTALGRGKRDSFVIQVDRFTHPYSHGWWPSDKTKWRKIR